MPPGRAEVWPAVQPRVTTDYSLLAKWGLRETAGEDHARLSLPWCQALPDLKTDRQFCSDVCAVHTHVHEGSNGAGCFEEVSESRGGKDPVCKPSLWLVPPQQGQAAFTHSPECAASVALCKVMSVPGSQVRAHQALSRKHF